MQTRPQSEGEDFGMTDQNPMNMMMQFAQMQMMAGNNTSDWNMSMTYPDAQAGQYGIAVHPPFAQGPIMHPPPFPYYAPQPPLMPMMGTGFDMNQPSVHNFQQPMDRHSGNSRNSRGEIEEDLDWSTRPRAANHLTKNALMYLPESSVSNKSARASNNLEQNILRSVQGLLEDDDEPTNLDGSDFQASKSGNFLSANKQTRSVENSIFGTAKNSSGWSDTTASKMNKTRRSGNESGSGPSLVTKSFGETKDTKTKPTASELSTIFEAKDGLLFDWQNSTSNQTEKSSKGRDTDLFEGFMLVDPEASPNIKRTDPQDTIYKSDFFGRNSNPPPLKKGGK